LSITTKSKSCQTDGKKMKHTVEETLLLQCVDEMAKNAIIYSIASKLVDAVRDSVLDANCFDRIIEVAKQLHEARNITKDDLCQFYGVSQRDVTAEIQAAHRLYLNFTAPQFDDDSEYDTEEGYDK